MPVSTASDDHDGKDTAAQSNRRGGESQNSNVARRLPVLDPEVASRRLASGKCPRTTGLRAILANASVPIRVSYRSSVSISGPTCRPLGSLEAIFSDSAHMLSDSGWRKSCWFRHEHVRAPYAAGRSLRFIGTTMLPCLALRCFAVWLGGVSLCLDNTAGKGCDHCAIAQSYE